MPFLGLFKREVDETELVWPARSMLNGVRGGLTEEAAAKAAEVDEAELRRWRRDPIFRAALGRARREPAREAQCINLRDYLAPPDPLGAPPPGASDFEIEAAGWRRVG